MLFVVDLVIKQVIMPGRRGARRGRQTSKTPSSSNGKGVSADKSPLPSAEVEQDRDDEFVALEKKFLASQQKCESMAEEMEKMNRKIQKKSRKVDKKKLDIASLREMDDVRRKVDHLMDKKGGNLRFSLSSSSEESSSGNSSTEDEYESSDSSSDSEKDERRSSSSRKGKKKGKGKHRKNKKGKSNHRSGKSRKMTSYVKYPQEWPHTHLSLHYVSKDKKFEDLTIEEFCAGYSTILETVRDQKLLIFRVIHLKDLMYLATRYRWDCVLSYHAACLLEIERGNVKWGDSFQTLQSTTLAGGFL